MFDLADMLTQMRNAQMVGKDLIEIPHSKLKESLALLLKQESYLEDVKVFKPAGEKFRRMALHLRYVGDTPAIGFSRVVSKPGQRIYSGADDFPQVLGGQYGIVVVSTSRGLMTAKEARKRRLGGEILCELW